MGCGASQPQVVPSSTSLGASVASVPADHINALLDALTQRDTTLQKLQAIEASGAPPMQLLPLEVLRRLQRIPRHSEGYTVDAAKACAQSPGTVVMVSHRWLRPGTSPMDGEPDDVENTIARVLLKLGLQHMAHTQVYFWIDFSCVDKKSHAKTLSMLPVYFAACNRIVYYETEDSDERAWCRLERLLAWAFMHNSGPPIHLSEDFLNDGVVEKRRCQRTLEDPVKGLVTVPSDMVQIQALTQYALRRQTGNFQEGWGTPVWGELWIAHSQSFAAAEPVSDTEADFAVTAGIKNAVVCFNEATYAPHNTELEFLSEYNKVAKNRTKGYMIVLGDTVLQDSPQRFMVDIEPGSPVIGVGVQESNAYRYGPGIVTKNQWVYWCHSGNFAHGAEETESGAGTTGFGQTLEIVYDPVQGTLSYSRGGIPFPTTHTGITGPVVPVFHLGPNAGVRLH